MNELEINKWYWLSHPHEGDIFHPVYILDSEYFSLDGDKFRIADNTGATFDKAVMPGSK